MRGAGYWLGLLLLVAGAAVGVAELLLRVADGGQSLTVGTLWYSLSANSLVGFQALIEKNVGPWLWTPVLWLLAAPGWLVLIVPGLLLFALCRPRSGGL